jgi:hypothetical protein
MKKTILSTLKLLVIVGVSIQLTFIFLDFSGQQEALSRLKHQLKENLSCIF